MRNIGNFTLYFLLAKSLFLSLLLLLIIRIIGKD